MPKVKGDINIGKRAREEIDKIFATLPQAANALRCDRKVFICWSNGTTPDTMQLAKMHYLGCDVMYILTGKRR